MSHFFDTLFVPFRGALKVMGGLLPEHRKVKESHLDGAGRFVSRFTLGQPFVEIFVHIDQAGSGAEYLGGDKRGVSHALEHMCCLATKSYPEKAIDIFTQNEGGYANAHTSYDEMVFKIRLPRKKWRNAVHMVSEMVCNPDLTDALFEGEKRVVLGERLTSKMNKPMLGFNQLAVDAFFDKQPFVSKIVGTKADIVSMCAEDLKQFHLREFRQERATIFFQGSVPHDKVREEFKKHFYLPSLLGRGTSPETKIMFPFQHRVADVRRCLPEEGVRCNLIFPLKGVYGELGETYKRYYFAVLMHFRLNPSFRKVVGVYDLNIANNISRVIPCSNVSYTAYPEMIGDSLSNIGNLLGELAEKGDPTWLENRKKNEQYWQKNKPLDYWREMTSWMNEYLAFGRSIPQKDRFDATMQFSNEDIKRIARSWIDGGYAFIAEGNVEGLPDRERVGQLLGMKPPPSISMK